MTVTLCTAFQLFSFLPHEETVPEEQASQVLERCCWRGVSPFLSFPFSISNHLHRTSPNPPSQPPSTTSSQHMAPTYMPYPSPYSSSPPHRYPPLPLHLHHPTSSWVPCQIPIRPPMLRPLPPFLVLLPLSLPRPSCHPITTQSLPAVASLVIPSTAGTRLSVPSAF